MYVSVTKYHSLLPKQPSQKNIHYQNKKHLPKKYNFFFFFKFLFQLEDIKRRCNLNYYFSALFFGVFWSISFSSQSHYYQFHCFSLFPIAMADNSKDDTKHSLIFTYGSLKRGFKNHSLIENLMAHNDAVFIGSCLTQNPYPLVIGPYSIGYLINLPGNGHRVKGEIYSVSARGLSRLDELEATRFGHYERLPIRVVRCHEDRTEPDDDVVEAEAYYAHENFGEALWNKKLIQCVSEFSEREDGEFVKGQDRLNGGRNFLDELRLFIASSEIHSIEANSFGNDFFFFPLPSVD